MAKPIRNTPILFGDDASKFIEQSQKSVDESVKIAERNRIAKSVQKLQSLINTL